MESAQTAALGRLQSRSQAAQLRSPVLTSIGFVIFDPPQNRRPLAYSKKMSQVIISMTSTAVQNLAEICPWGLLGK